MRVFFTAFVCVFFSFTSTGASSPYFQQEVNYRIQVRLDDTAHELFATESIDYTNNSSHELPFLYFHIWPNAYKNNSTLFAKQLEENGDLKFHFAKEENRGFIDQLDFKVDGQPVKWEFAGDTLDICRVWMNTPLKPGQRITITTPFHVKIPLGIFSRLGHLGQQYQITQWYPKPAVYDRNGWNQIPFLNQGEFYSEFGTFDVEITLPKNYVLGATGDLVGGEEEKQFIRNKVEETNKWVEEFKLTGKTDMQFPASDSQTKTLHFHQDKVHDFAWFCDKRYHILQGEVETPHEKRKVTTSLLFTDSQAEQWIKALPYLHDAIYFYSLWNGDYPYDQVTAVDGGLSAGSGMEYPNITVVGNTADDFTLETVIVHEVGHNWFYGILGSNERTNPWMDEGINSFNENRYIETKHPDAKLIGSLGINSVGKLLDLDRYLHKEEYYLSYMLTAKKELDQPIQLPAGEYTSLNYGGIVYSKTAISFDYLMAYLGTKTMDIAMQQYYATWKYKHPQPDDLRKILEKASARDLSWFFDDMIIGTKKLDYKIKASRPVKTGFEIIVKNTGQIKGPIAICGIKNNVLRGIVWYDGFWGTEVLSFPPVEEGVDYFMIDYNSDMPEINRKNNILRTKGALKRIEPIKLQFLTSLDRPDRTQLFWTPVAGWNDYNKFMFGAAVYNTTLTQKRVEFALMPLYAGGSKTFAGAGHVTLNLPFRSSFLQQISATVSGSHYAYNDVPFTLNYTRVVPELNFEVRKKHARSHLQQNIRVRGIFLLLDDVNRDFIVGQIVSSRKTDTVMIGNITYSLNNTRKLNPYGLVIDYQTGQQMQKLSLTANYEITFDKKKSLDIRFFAGTFLQTDQNPAYAFRMSGENGQNDYLYDHIYLGRNESSGVLSQQFSETDGAFKTFSPWGATTKWLTALNLKASLPYLPRQIRLYMDFGTCDQSSLNTANGGAKLFYDGGVNVSLIKNIFEIYLPVIMSPEIHDYLYTTRQSNYLETIRVSLNLNLINPFELLKKITL
jgi:hypothetical protein